MKLPYFLAQPNPHQFCFTPTQPNPLPFSTQTNHKMCWTHGWPASTFTVSLHLPQNALSFSLVFQIDMPSLDPPPVMSDFAVAHAKRYPNAALLLLVPFLCLINHEHECHESAGCHFHEARGQEWQWRTGARFRLRQWRI
jgi:hypothetical protein